MKTYVNPPCTEWQRLCKRPANESGNFEAAIASIFETVQKDGDRALINYTKQFDGVVLNQLEAGPEQIRAWADQVPFGLRKAIDNAYSNITAFHKAQADSLHPIEVGTVAGVSCWRESRPIGRVGLYVPGGSAPLFSTVLMLGVPAQLAGCREVVLCTPPQSDSSINPAICYAAGLVGITKIFRIGGAQAIAALACGTGSVPKVDKIFGPGNQYVTAAKLYAGRFGTAIDMPAGPSEVMVIADSSARPDFVAADLLSQAEHGPDSQVVLACTSIDIFQAVKGELDSQLKSLPRNSTAKQALASSFCVVVGDVGQALAFAEAYAPEHLILSVANPKKAAAAVVNAGSVFLGNYTPESAGDYASGTNHTLPTNGWARTYSGLSLESFCKYVTFQSITKKGAKNLAPVVMTMAEAEGLMAHKRAMEIRL